MDTYTRSLGYRQFMWGLSNGIGVLAIAGTFWCSMAVLWTGWPVVPIALAIGAVVAAAGVRIRRRASGFRLRELESAGEPERARARRIRVGFRWVWLIESVLVGAAVWACQAFHREDLIWPAMALAISLHFLPIARLVSVRSYYATAALGSALAIVLLALPEALLAPTVRMAIAGLGMAAIVWGSAIYVALRAERLAVLWDDASGFAR